MEIFETKSRYYVNGNAPFAGVFSNMAITIVTILIGIVLLVWFAITCIHWSWEAKLCHNVQKQLESYGFAVGHLKLVDNLDAGSGQELLRFVLVANRLSNSNLLEGHPCEDVRIVATTQSWGGAEFNVTNIELSNLPDGLFISSWVDWVYAKLNPPKPAQDTVEPRSTSPPADPAEDYKNRRELGRLLDEKMISDLK